MPLPGGCVAPSHPAWRVICASATLGRIAGLRRSPISMQMSDPELTVYHDGSCPLCRLEIGHYRREQGAERIRFVDVADLSTDLGPGLTRQDAMGRFHVRLSNGELRTGATAFAEIWKRLPRWRPAALATRVPGVTLALEAGYRVFTPIRPTLARVVSRLNLA